MALEISDAELRIPQKEAIDKIIAYITSYHNGETNGACLINMPTGSGKSGVITCVCRCLDNIASALVLSPRVAIRDQLFSDIDSGFFNIIDEDSDKKNSPNLITDNTSLNLIDDYHNGTYVLTIQKLISIYKNQNDSFNSISDDIDIILVDEGHYEPAPTWGATIRKINAPKIIFTATPFRNDLKAFDISIDHTYCYTYSQAAEDNLIRSVEFVELDKIDNENDFVSSIVNYYDNNFDGENSKVIIQCEDSNTIRRISSCLRDLGKECVSIHENFNNSPDRYWEYKKVPNPRENDATYWIHQFKLLEGIDEPSFKLLAIYTALKDSRKLVQQIGRIVRNISNTPESGIVLDHSNGIHKTKWERFIKYDKMLSKDPKYIEIAIGNKLADHFINAQPPALYHARDFRSALDLEKINISDDVYVNLSANIFIKTEDFTIDKAAESLKAHYKKFDHKYKKFSISNNCLAYLYIKIENSPILETDLFLETKLCLTVVVEKNDYVYQYDSSGIRLDAVMGMKPLNSSKKLNILFLQDNNARITDISLKNSNLGTSAIRGKRLNAFSMDETSPQLDDHAQIYISARGNESNSAGRTRRYVSFRKGKISDSKHGKLKLENYISWIDFIDERLVNNGDNSISKAFAKYSTEKEPPQDVTPKHILIDLADASNIFTSKTDGNPALEAPELTADITDNQFSINMNDKDYTLEISYQQSKSVYQLACPEITEDYESTEKEIYGSDPIDYLNKNQNFRVVPETDNYIYAYGQFYQPFIKYGPAFSEHEYIFNSVLHSSETLTTTSSEKGKKCKEDSSGWEDKSLFEILRTLGAGTDLEGYIAEKRIDIIVCDDMNYESADFILASSKTNFIAACHAKAKKTASHVSASHLHDVCSQATKNIGYLSPYTTLTPSNITRWDGYWTAPKVEGTVANRVISPQGDNAEAVWEKIKRITQDPNSDKQVWIVLGQILSKNRFLENIVRESPPANSIQALYLIQSTMDSVSSIGAKLKILCSS
jgi:superfamily II DNA or RNA helicase